MLEHGQGFKNKPMSCCDHQSELFLFSKHTLKHIE